jgi:hypothetical protein
MEPLSRYALNMFKLDPTNAGNSERCYLESYRRFAALSTQHSARSTQHYFVTHI